MRQQLQYFTKINAPRSTVKQGHALEKDEEQNKNNFKSKTAGLLKNTLQGAITINSIVQPTNGRDRGLPAFHETGNQKLIEEQKRKLQDEKTKNEKLVKEIENFKKN